MPATEKVIELNLTDMKQSIRKGWVQGSLGAPYEPSGPVCLRGATVREVKRLAGNNFSVWLESDRLDILEAPIREAIRVLFSGRCGEDQGYGISVVRFNDHPATTIDDVLQVLDKSLEIVHGSPKPT